MRKSRVKFGLLIAAISATMIGLAGCSGSDGAAGAPGAPGTPADPAVTDSLQNQITALQTANKGETCSLCHSGSGAIAQTGYKHQSSYDELYQAGVLTIEAGSMALATNGTDTTTLTFKIADTRTGGYKDCTATTDGFTIGSYWASYDSATNTFPDDLSLVGSKAYNTVTGVCTITKTVTTASDKAIVAKIAAALANTAGNDGIVQLYGTDSVVETITSAHMTKGKYPFAAVMRFGSVMGAAAAPYQSQANVTGCENCHTQPFLKHAYIFGTVKDLTAGSASATQNFYVCKGCHYDQRDGHDAFWQLLQEAKLADPATTDGAALRARAAAVNGGAALTADETTKYAYKAKLMNDVHMSHAMEFAYPQSMRNCVTCHAGKMDETNGIFKLANFKAETCISCHSVDGITAKMKAAAFTHPSYVTDAATLKATNCTVCHDGSAAPKFATIHTGGYDPLIYASDGTRYSTSIVTTIDSISIASNVLDIKFSATGTVGTVKATDITPSVMVGLYGYDTKDFIVSAHANAADGKRNLEYTWGDGNPRFTPVSAANGAWEVKVDLSLWADQITAGTIKRAEIAVRPAVKNADGNTVGLNAPSKTFNLDGVTDDSNYFADIVNVAKTNVTNSKGAATIKGCNTCHDQLATTFHSGDRGGNIKVCRLCHVKSAGGSHLEIQSRSIDSYVHAIHTFQEFDIKNVDFTNAFDKMEYETHIGTQFPRFGATANQSFDCESCHTNATAAQVTAGTYSYNVSDQSKSLPALMSASATVASWPDRSIGGIPSYVTGPAANACGGCHRADAINNDASADLSTMMQHWTQQGYMIDASVANWDTVVASVMAKFK